MAEVPSPLRVGSPAVAKRPSVESIPSSLRAGSPVVERGEPFTSQRPPLRRKNTSGSDRLSQLFPSRPASVVSISPDETPGSRRRSYPSPLVAPAEPSYRIPRAPAPPSFSDDTSYSNTPDPFEHQGAHSALKSHGGTKRLLNRLATLRSGRARGSEYNQLGDEESGSGRRPLKNVDEAEEAVGYDLSGLAGMPMNKFEPNKMTSATDAMEQERHLSEAGFAAEYERLESQLGAGMSSIMEVPFTHKDAPARQEASRGIGHRRGLSSLDVPDNAAKDAQKEAEKTGGIVAVSEIPVDISESFVGADLETRSVLTTGGADKDGSQTSYYFPPDPDMPAWRPVTMGWPWISFLIIVALLLAGLQECLCQLSMKRAREDKENGGLMKFTKPDSLSIRKYFLWKYAPIILFLLYGILWQMTDFEVKRLEPFYQLSKKTGATAAESLNMDYLTFMSWLVPLRALRHKQYAVIYSSLATLIASSLVPVLQSTSINMYPPHSKRKANEFKSIRIDPPWSRAVTGCLVFVAISGGVLAYEMRRKSGLLSDPNGIAGIAAMATKSHIMMEFEGMDTQPLEKIHKKLRHRRYILHKSSLWQGEYIRNSTEKRHDYGSDPRPVMLRLKAGVPYVAYIILFAISIPIFTFVEEADAITEKLPFLMTGLASIVKLLWGTMSSDVRMLEPFYILAQRHAPAKTLTLDYTGTNPIFLPFKALLNRHYLVSIVGVGAILCEVLVVCVSSLSVDGKKFIPGQGGEDDRYNTDQTFRSFWASFALAMLILIFLVAVACSVYSRRAHKFMPRQIGTMASVLAFIHQSKMLVSFVDTEKFNSAQMTRHLTKHGKTYALGWFQGRDGEDHCGIDEEPMLAPYKYGVDWAKTRVLGSQIGTWEHY